MHKGYKLVVIVRNDVGLTELYSYNIYKIKDVCST